MTRVSLTAQEKLNALALRFYQGLEWRPAAGDYYTSSRADLELYRIVRVDGERIYTEYCSQPGVLTDWDAKEFTSVGFGLKRVWVPHWVLR